MLTRRTMLASGGAASASLFGLPAAPTFGAAATVRTAVDLTFPAAPAIATCTCSIRRTTRM